MKKIFVGWMVLGMMLCGACSNDEGSADNTRKDIPVSRAEAELVECDNVFTQKFVGVLGGDAALSQKNFVVSPLSVTMSMSMLADGTAGETRGEILRALGYESEDVEDANSLNKKLLEELPKADGTTKVALANRLWYPETLSGNFRDSYREVLSAYYGASFAGLKDLGGHEGMDAINKWVEDNTHGMIPKFLAKPLGDVPMVLTNALYFKGQWASKFDKKLTSKADFRNADGSVSRVDMMKNPALSAQAYQDVEDGYKLALLDYGNSAYCMAVILPDEGKDPAEVFAQMDVDDMEEYVMNGKLGKKKLNFRMPRFEIETRADIISTLDKLGIRTIFSPSGDYSEMFNTPMQSFYIGRMQHGAKIIVDEEGSEAAGSTMNVGDIMPAPMPSDDFIVDRPFAFAIVERSTGVILFAGVVKQL